MSEGVAYWREIHCRRLEWSKVTVVLFVTILLVGWSCGTWVGVSQNNHELIHPDFGYNNIKSVYR